MALSVSIAMATYNGEKYISEQLDSLAAQSHLPDELVVVDDGSTDSTLEKVSRFKERAPFPVSIYQNETRLGYRYNFMKAAHLCRSELISFCDQDDIWREDKLASVLPVFEDPDVLLVHHDLSLIDANGAYIGAFQPDYERLPRRAAMLGKPWPYPYGLTETFRASLTRFNYLHSRTAGLFDPEGVPFGHDWWVGFLALSLGETVYLDVPLVKYRQHQSNLYGAPKTRRRRLYRKLKNQMQDRSPRFRGLAHNCKVMADIIKEAGACLDTESRRQIAVKSSKNWEQLSHLYELRLHIHGSSRLRARCEAFIQTFRQNAYGMQEPWSFGTSSLINDLIGVFLSPLRMKYGEGQPAQDSSVYGTKLSS